jgi:hypothetical protein
LESIHRANWSHARIGKEVAQCWDRRHCEAEEGYFNETMTVLLKRVSDRGVAVESAQGLDIDGGEFVSSAEWRIGLGPFIMGVANADPDLPVSVLARFRVDSCPA